MGRLAVHRRAVAHRALHGEARDRRGRQARRGADREARGVPAEDAEDQRQGDDQGAAPLDLRRGRLHELSRFRRQLRRARHRRGRGRCSGRALARCGPGGGGQRRLRPEGGGVAQHRWQRSALVRAEHRRAGNACRRHSRAARLGSEAVRGLQHRMRRTAELNGFDFKFSLTLNGSSELTFAPVAQQTTVALTSDWRDPSFMGAFLPNDRVLNPASFAARWQIPHLARSVPQSWSLSDQELERMHPYAFGVRFIVPVDFYQLVSRAAKYAMMFLATAFMAVFLLEIGSPRHVHPVQYLFVGLTMIFFYVLLLSLAEQIGFLWAYLIAAVATGGLLSLYVWRAQQSLNKGLVMAGVLLRAVRAALSDPAAGGLRAARRCHRRLRYASGRHVLDASRRLVRTEAHRLIGSPKRARSTSRPLPVPAGTAHTLQVS